MVASQSHVLHWQRCTAAATAPGATGGHGVGSHVADAENSGAPPSPLPSPVATSALNEGLVVGQPLPLFRAFLFLSSDGNPLLSLSLFSFSSSGLDRFLSPSFPVYLFSRGRPACVRRARRGEHRRSRARSAKLVTFQSCNALWTHAPTSRAVNLRTTRLFIIEEYERL